MQQAFMDRVQERIISRFRSFAPLDQNRRSAMASNASLNFLRICATPQVGPPQRPLDDDDERAKEGEENRPHDRPALDEEVHDDIGK